MTTSQAFRKRCPVIQYIREPLITRLEKLLGFLALTACRKPLTRVFEKIIMAFLINSPLADAMQINSAEDVRDTKVSRD